MRRVNYLITLVVTLIIFTEQGTGQENYPRTTSGRPDFNGHYDISTLTPFERPASFGNRQALSEEEVEELRDQEMPSQAILIEKHQKKVGTLGPIMTFGSTVVMMAS